MGRSERRDYFERLCILRDSYGAQPDDRRGTLSIEDAVIYAEAVMIALDEPEWSEADDSVAVAADAGIPIDATDATGAIEATDAVRPGDGQWMSDTDGWRHLGRFFDRHGPAGERLD
jgi:hypothetical protein